MHFGFIIFSVILFIQQLSCEPNPQPSTASSWFGQAANYLPTGYFSSDAAKGNQKGTTKPAVVTKPTKVTVPAKVTKPATLKKPAGVTKPKDSENVDANSWFGQAASYLPTSYFPSARGKEEVAKDKTAAKGVQKGTTKPAVVTKPTKVTMPAKVTRPAKVTKPAAVTKPKAPENVAVGSFANIGIGMLSDLKNGGTWGNLMNSGKGAMSYLPFTEQMRNLAVSGVGFQNVVGTMQSYASQYPVAAELMKYIEMAEKISQAAGYLNGGFAAVKHIAFTPMTIIEAAVVGRAVYKGVQVYLETGDLKKAALAASSLGLLSAVDVINGVPGAKIGVTIDAKSLENMMASGKEVINSMSMSEQMRYLAMIGISAAEAIKEGKSVNEIITEFVKGTLLEYATKHLLIKDLVKYVDWIKGSWLFA